MHLVVAESFVRFLEFDRLFLAFEPEVVAVASSVPEPFALVALAGVVLSFQLMMTLQFDPVVLE